MTASEYNRSEREGEALAAKMNFYDVAYWIGLGVSSPYWLLRGKSRDKVLRAFRQRMGRMPNRNWQGPCVMIHAVSLGEVNATRALVSMLHRARADLNFVITTTTETGFERAKELYGAAANAVVVRYPLDFSSAVNRTLDAVKPTVVALMELEVWPNFIRECQKRDIRVALINGRMTETSYRNYKWIRPVAASMFRRLAGICVQDQTYADRFVDLGAPMGRVLVTGSMKFDTAQITDRIPGARDLADDLGLRLGIDKVWVCGSTGPGEEDAILRVYRSMLMRHPRLRLLIVPRHPERFDEVASIIEEHRFACIRRSSHISAAWLNSPIPPVILGDTIGELRKFYSFADVVFVGRTLVDLGPRQHGSDMIEPAALGKPVVVGPFTGNFAEPMSKFVESDAIRVVANEEELERITGVLLSTPDEGLAMAQRAVAVIRKQQGATLRHAEVILGLIGLSERGLEARAIEPPMGA
jgi:3-deoxy-D-manno-octulosonic-acid transferase